MSQYAFLVNSNCCSGCKTCQVACKDKNDLPAHVNWRKVYEVTAGGWQRKEAAWDSTVTAYNLSVSCNHCLNPVCLPPCPTQAIWKTDSGIVLIEESLCRNCRLCINACPYGAIYFDPLANTTTKCDFCADNLETGLPPACVAACPNRALDYGEHAELKKRYGDLSHVFPLPSPSIAGPALIILPHRNTALAASLGPVVANSEEL